MLGGRPAGSPAALDGIAFVAQDAPLREQLTVVQGHQLGSVWVNLVHGSDLGRSAPTARRRRALILALPNGPGQFTPISAIPLLTPDLATHYAGKTRKTLTRDINCLQEAGLLVREGAAVRPFLEQMFAFLPLRKQPGRSERRTLDTLASASVPNPDSPATAESRGTDPG